MKQVKYKDLTRIQKILLDKAEEVMENSYNPYSRFSVGAAILTKDYKIIKGTNNENSAYGSTNCAEVAAILEANNKKYRMFKSIAVIAKGRMKNGKYFDTKEPTAPCGNCRQKIFESSQISGTNLEVIMSNTKKTKIIISSIEELLPMGFGPKDLGIDVSEYQK